MSNVQITEELFLMLLDYFLRDNQDDYLADQIVSALNDKVDKLVARQLFTDYKRAATPAERESARLAYLDHAGISPKFRSKTEFHN